MKRLLNRRDRYGVLFVAPVVAIAAIAMATRAQQAGDVLPK